MKRFVVVVAGIVAFTLAGCYYDKEEELYGVGAPCDPGVVTYSSTITGILSGYGCMTCHVGTNASGNISLQGYGNVRIVALNGKLLGSISHSAGFSPMPQGGNKMSACDISKVKVWVDGGAVNN